MVDKLRTAARYQDDESRPERLKRQGLSWPKLRPVTSATGAALGGTGKKIHCGRANQSTDEELLEALADLESARTEIKHDFRRTLEPKLISKGMLDTLEDERTKSLTARPNFAANWKKRTKNCYMTLRR
jgi:hypothetical protein